MGAVWFGAEVRRRRMAEGRSLRTLGAEIFLSHAYLGKIEQGHARGTYQIALALDSVLEADGKLAELFLDECARIGPVPADTAVLDEGAKCAGCFASTDPAELAVEAAERLETLRVRSHEAGPHAVVEPLSEAVAELHDRAVEASAEVAEQLWSVALRYAELLGWTAQETGHEGTALRWTRVAAEWARRIGDADALAYAWIRQSQWARRKGDANAAVRCARMAMGIRETSPRIRLFAAQREAQACAFAGDETSFRRALDRYHTLVGENPSAGTSSGAQWGPLPDPGFETSGILEATCLVDLGDFDAAATLFAQQMSRFRSGRTGYARLAVREAIAYAQIGSPELACDVALYSLPTLVNQGSASLRGDLGRLVRILNRHRGKAAVRDLLPDLTMLAHAAGAVPANRDPGGATDVR
jgi:transcriptional regulator with XRE-family HTH domain